MKHKIFSHTSLLIILSVILTFLAAGTVMYNRYDIYNFSDKDSVTISFP